MRAKLKNLVVGLFGAFSLVYLLNPSLGVFEFIPDNLPVIGNLDEATATAILLASLAHFGYDLRGWLQRFGFGPKQVERPSTVESVTRETT